MHECNHPASGRDIISTFCSKYILELHCVQIWHFSLKAFQEQRPPNAQNGKCPFPGEQECGKQPLRFWHFMWTAVKLSWWWRYRKDQDLLCGDDNFMELRYLVLWKPDDGQIYGQKNHISDITITYHLSLELLITGMILFSLFIGYICINLCLNIIIHTSTGSHRYCTSLLLLPPGFLPLCVVPPPRGPGWYCGSAAAAGGSPQRKSSWDERERDVSVEDSRVVRPSK